MHIPDNYLSPSTCAVVTAVMVPVWAKCIKKVKEEIPKESLPMLSIGASFSFLLMMFNVPLPGGTTGHAVGATLLAVLIGPYAAALALTVALFIQAIIFGDGGIISFGVNAFNMAFIMPFAGYYIYNLIKKLFKNEKISLFIASYISINLAALFASIELGIQPLLFKDSMGLPLYNPYPLSISVPAMVIPHLLVAGIVEGAFTVLIYSYVRKVSFKDIYSREIKFKPLYILIAVLAVLSPIGLLASGSAWGEWGIDEIKKLTGYIPRGMGKGFSFSSPLPNYAVGNISPVIGYILSAAAGIAILIIIFKIFLTQRD
jgi:cobalt/nickel transport system permease protein